MNFYIDIIEASHMLWLQIKLLRNAVRYIEISIDSDNGNEGNFEAWPVIISKVEDLVHCMTSKNAIFAVLYLNQNHTYKVQGEVLEKYELLINDLSKLLLIRDYNIIQNYDAFFNSFNDVLSFFESELKNLYKKLSKLCINSLTEQN